MSTDPVCGMRVDENQARELGLTVDFAGREFFFCSESCRQSFVEQPARYLAP